MIDQPVPWTPSEEDLETIKELEAFEAKDREMQAAGLVPPTSPHLLAKMGLIDPPLEEETEG